MEAIESLEIGVLIIAKMSKEYIAVTGGDTGSSKDAEAAARAFAMEVHGQWGVGEKQSRNGVLLFLSIKDRAFFLSMGKGAMLSKQTLDEKFFDHEWKRCVCVCVCVVLYVLLLFASIYSTNSHSCPSHYFYSCEKCKKNGQHNYLWDTMKYGKICLECNPYFKRKDKLIAINKSAEDE